MSKHASDEEFVCPYFRWSRGLRVGCEGDCRVALPDRTAFDSYIGAHCCNLPGWEQCSLAKAREAFYARAD